MSTGLKFTQNTVIYYKSSKNLTSDKCHSCDPLWPKNKQTYNNYNSHSWQKCQ